jgi:hypothetical protein
MASFRNINRRPQRSASATFLAFLAMAVAVPYPALGCCATSSKESCCCKQQEEAAATRSCCHKPETPASSSASETQDQCSAGTCPCCQQSPPQNVPTDRTADRVPVDHGFAVPIANWSIASAFAIAQSLDSPVDYLTAIPHRILHCSWLI